MRIRAFTDGHANLLAARAERARNRKAAEARAGRLARARCEARRIAAEVARIDPCVTEVWLFGSVATGRPGRDRFDMDLVDLDTVRDRFRDRRGSRKSATVRT